MSERKKPPAGRLLHDALTAEAQRLIDAEQSIDSIHANIVEIVNDYRGPMPDRLTDPDGKETELIAWSAPLPSGGASRWALIERPRRGEDVKYIRAEERKRMRIHRETVLAATSRVIGDIIIKNVLSYARRDGIDIPLMLQGYRPEQYYNEGLNNFLEESVDEAIVATEDPKHQYHSLFRYASQIDYNYLASLENEAMRTGAKLKGWNTIYSTLQDTFALNNQDMVAPFMVMHAISMRNRHDALPDGETISAATAEMRPHWIAIASMTRIAFQNLHNGDGLSMRLRADAEQIGTLPTWLTHWPQAISYAMAGEDLQPFMGCPLQSPLLGADAPMVVKPFRSPGHCSGNIALKASYQANENAAWFFEFLDGDISPDGRYLPAALLVDLGRAAAKYAYSEPMFRDALAKGWRRTRIAGSSDTTHEFR